ncbi:MAG: hypothetical protein KJZ78_28740 [Bryobacteraceae bacterium]|nr:hypothetical protein [Bryobacteraceae bacterium]
MSLPKRSSPTGGALQFQDRVAEEAFKEVAALLATAYQRYLATGYPPPEEPVEAAANELDNSCSSSLHGQ